MSLKRTNCGSAREHFQKISLTPLRLLQSESVQSRRPADASWYYDFSEPIETDRTRVSPRVGNLAIIRKINKNCGGGDFRAEIGKLLSNVACAYHTIFGVLLLFLNFRIS